MGGVVGLIHKCVDVGVFLELFSVEWGISVEP